MRLYLGSTAAVISVSGFIDLGKSLWSSLGQKVKVNSD